MLTQSMIQQELSVVYQQIHRNLPTFEALVPAAVSTNYVYAPVVNEDWTDAFWVGMLQLAQCHQYSDVIADVIDKQLGSFSYRLAHHIVLDHHDIGFLYSLSAVADFRLRQTPASCELALAAADVLMQRYQPTAEIFQAWGAPDDAAQQGRMIIDSTMNLPLLYFAARQTGKSMYHRAAYAHVKQAQRYLIRSDHSTFHTFYMDVETGAPKFGTTAQGASDTSCWARGQAWGIYGFVLSYSYTGDPTLLVSACDLADYFIAHLPTDYIPYWDLSFKKGDGEERDTSAAAIAACGLLELAKQLPMDNERHKVYETAACHLIESLMMSYTTKQLPHSNGLLTQGVYSKPENLGVDECTLWGDYFYYEALTRLSQDWTLFW